MSSLVSGVEYPSLRVCRDFRRYRKGRCGEWFIQGRGIKHGCEANRGIHKGFHTLYMLTTSGVYDDPLRS